MQRRQLLRTLGTLTAVIGLAFLGLGASVQAQAQAQAQAPAADMASGEITRLDMTGGRLGLKHGEIKNLDMPPMTMVFRVRDKAMLDGLAVGDRVRFRAERIEGSYTVTAVSKAP